MSVWMTYSSILCADFRVRLGCWVATHWEKSCSLSYLYILILLNLWTLVKRIVMRFYTYMYSNGVEPQVLTTIVKDLPLVVKYNGFLPFWFRRRDFDFGCDGY